MPLIKSAVKKMKQDKRRYAQNLRTKRAIRASVKNLESKLTYEAFREAQSAIDTAVKKRVLSKAAAARRLSHLSKFAKENGVKIASAKKSAPAKAAKTASEKPAKTAEPKKPAAKKAPAKAAAKAKKA